MYLIRSYRPVVVILVLASGIWACLASSPVRDYFAQSGYSYPLQISLPTVVRPIVVCVGCPDTAQRLAPEYEELLVSGRKFLKSDLSITLLQDAIDAEAFVIVDAYLFEDPPGAPVALAARLSGFRVDNPQTHDPHGPVEWHATTSGDVLEIKNILVLERVEDKWRYRGLVY